MTEFLGVEFAFVSAVDFYVIFGDFVEIHSKGNNDKMIAFLVYTIPGNITFKSLGIMLFTLIFEFSVMRVGLLL